MAADRTVQLLRAAMRGRTGPLYLGIADAIGHAIAEGELAAGDRLPPQRHVAQALGVDLTTVTRGYAEAHRRGLLDGEIGRGTFVRGGVAGAVPGGVAAAVPGGAVAGADAGLIDMGMNLPPQPAPLRRLLREGLADLVQGSDPRALMTYRAGAGSSRDRAAAAAWLRPILGMVEPERLLVCPGAQCALTAVLTTLARPGDAVLAEAMTYPGFRALAAQLGLRLVPVAMDAEGLLPDAVAAACRQVSPKALYCIPTMHNPTTATLPLARRRALATLALQAGVPIIEDDAYGQLAAQALPAITALEAGVGYYIGTLSKCLSPGLRTAFVAAPGRSEASRLVAAVRATALAASPLLMSLTTRWLEDGTAADLRDAIRQEAVARQQIARQILSGATLAAHPQGLHLWLTLPPAWNRSDFTAYMRRRALALVPSDSFTVAATAPNAVRLCTGAAPDRSALEAALQAVAEALRMDPPTHLADIV